MRQNERVICKRWGDGKNTLCIRLPLRDGRGTILLIVGGIIAEMAYKGNDQIRRQCYGTLIMVDTLSADS